MQIQETFTEEWDLTREDALSYSFTQAQLEDFHRECTLRELARLPDEEQAPIRARCRMRSRNESSSCETSPGPTG